MTDESSKLPQREIALRVASQKIKIDNADNSLDKNVVEQSALKVTSNEHLPEEKLNDQWTTIFLKAPEIARHTVTLLLALFSLGIIHLTVKYVLGDPKFFGLIPVQWVVDVGDIAMLIKFIWHIVRDSHR